MNRNQKIILCMLLFSAFFICVPTCSALSGSIDIPYLQCAQLTIGIQLDHIQPPSQFQHSLPIILIMGAHLQEPSGLIVGLVEVGIWICLVQVHGTLYS